MKGVRPRPSSLPGNSICRAQLRDESRAEPRSEGSSIAARWPRSEGRPASLGAHRHPYFWTFIGQSSVTEPMLVWTTTCTSSGIPIARAGNWIVSW